MKKLVIIALLCVGFSIVAQETTGTKIKGNKENNSSKKMGEMRLEKMVTDLNLTADQKEQMKSIIEEQTTKIDAFKMQHKANKDTGIEPTDAEKKEMRMKMKAEKETTDAKIKSILTDEQYTKHLEIQKERKEKMKSRQKPMAAE